MEQRIEQWLNELTIEEKAALTVGASFWSTEPIERLGIPSINMTDGPHGVRKAQANTEIGFDSIPATCFPTASALASSWNTELLERIGHALGQESQALDVQVLLGPGINMKRSPLCGRNFEYFSEDPLLSGTLGTAWVRGVQGEGVGTSLKHYALNNQEHERMTISAEVDERAMHEIYLSAFEQVVKEAQPATIMAAYNKINGVYATEHEYLLEHVLRERWGFEGVVVSDWGAVNDKPASIRAGMDLQMPGRDDAGARKLAALVRSGEFPEALLDRVVRRILRLATEVDSHRRMGASFDAEAHHQLAREAAAECIVLLKNEAGLLPLHPDRQQHVAVIGRFAREPRFQGAGSSQIVPTQVDSVLAELEKLAGGRMRFTYCEGYGDSAEPDEALIAAAVEAARGADAAIIMAGLPPAFESEGFDRKHMDMPAAHDRLIEAVCAAQPATAVVLVNGAAVAMPWVDAPQAIVESWLTGQASGGAVADVLLGAVNPSGKLSETFPVRLQDTPAYLNFPGEHDHVHYGEGIFIGYRYYDKKGIKPLFPFGYGLSYTTFALSDLQLSSSGISDQEALNVSLQVTNTGSMAGAEVVQVYVRDMACSVLRPERELKAFGKVWLAPGETQTVTLTLHPRSFAFYDTTLHNWRVESGSFEIAAGTSSADLPLRQTVEVTTAEPYAQPFHSMSLLKHVLTRYRPEQALVMLFETLGAEPPQSGALYQDEFMLTFAMDMPIGKLAKMLAQVDSEQAINAWIDRLNEQHS